MWQYRRILSWPPAAWAFWSALAVLLPYAGVLWWLRAQLVRPEAWLAAGLLWVAFGAVRGLAALWYTVTVRWHGGWLVWQGGATLMQVNPWRALWIGVWDWPTGVLLGLAAAWSHLFATPPGGWWWMAAIGIPAAQALLLAGSAWLYTWIIVSMSQPLEGTIDVRAGETRLAALVPRRVRTVFGTLAFAWVVAGSITVILLLMLGLAILAHEVPAGYFGVSVALFVGFAMAVAGFPAAVVIGLWSQGLAWLYQRWGRRGLGFAWREECREVPVG
jgi:hypothetical protein